MAIIKNNLVSTAVVNHEDRYSGFTTFFRIPFKKADPTTIFADKTAAYIWKKVLPAWSEVCIRALEARMDKCVSMLFRNRNNVVISDERKIVFKKANGQYHTFFHPSFKAMEDMKKYLENGDWLSHKPKQAEARQLLKALYWISEEDKQEKNGYDFDELTFWLEEFTHSEES